MPLAPLLPRTAATLPGSGDGDGAPLLTDPVTGVEALQGAIVVVTAVVLAVLARRLLVRALDRGDSDRHTGRLVGRFVSLLVVVLGLLWGLRIVGVQVTPLVGALGVGGVALAFALQDVLQNFVAGVLLQVRRPFTVGHEVRLGEHEGRVEDVNLRTTILTTYDGLSVYVPNATVLKNPIVNYTRTPLSRTSLSVGISYGDDLRTAVEVVRSACRSAEGVITSPPAEVWVEELAESSVTLAVRYWHGSAIATRWRVRSAVALAVKEALDAAGITIPFPQRTLWLGGADAGAVAAALQVHPSAGPGAPPAPHPRADRGDGTAPAPPAGGPAVRG